MNFLQKFRSTLRPIALIATGLCMAGSSGALNHSNAVQNVLSAKNTPVKTAGPDMLELLNQLVGSIWILVVIVVAMLVLQEIRRPLEKS